MKFKRYEEGDEALILDLRRSIRGQTHTPEYWKWRYAGNPAGHALIWLAIADSVAVGHTAMVPHQFRLGDSTVRAGLSVDAWTHAAYRGRGIFKGLHARLLRDAADQGISFAYSFPNRLACPEFLKLGYAQVLPLRARHKVLSWGPVLEAKSRVSLLGSLGRVLGGGLQLLNDPAPVSGIKIRASSRFDERFDDLWSRVCEHNGAMTVRSSDYLNWRYGGNPRYRYHVYVAEENGRILGYVVLNCIESDLVRGYVVDLLAVPDSPHVLNALLAASIDHFREQGTHMVHCWAQEGSPHSRMLSRRGFYWSEPVRFCSIKLRDTALDPMDSSLGWWLCPGDYDL